MVKIYKQRIGSRAQVMHETAKMTSGGLTKKHLKYNKHHKIVSRKASNAAKKSKNLIKAGYLTKKGHFGVFKKGGAFSSVEENIQDVKYKVNILPYFSESWYTKVLGIKFKKLTSQPIIAYLLNALKSKSHDPLNNELIEEIISINKLFFDIINKQLNINKDISIEISFNKIKDSLVKYKTEKYVNIKFRGGLEQFEKYLNKTENVIEHNVNIRESKRNTGNSIASTNNTRNSSESKRNTGNSSESNTENSSESNTGNSSESKNIIICRHGYSIANSMQDMYNDKIRTILKKESWDLVLDSRLVYLGQLQSYFFGYYVLSRYNIDLNVYTSLMTRAYQTCICMLNGYKKAIHDGYNRDSIYKSTKYILMVGHGDFIKDIYKECGEIGKDVKNAWGHTCILKDNRFRGIKEIPFDITSNNRNSTKSINTSNIPFNNGSYDINNLLNNKNDWKLGCFDTNISYLGLYNKTFVVSGGMGINNNNMPLIINTINNTKNTRNNNSYYFYSTELSKMVIYTSQSNKKREKSIRHSYNQYFIDNRLIFNPEKKSTKGGSQLAMGLIPTPTPTPTPTIYKMSFMYVMNEIIYILQSKKKNKIENINSLINDWCNHHNYKYGITSHTYNYLFSNFINNRNIKPHTNNK